MKFISHEPNPGRLRPSAGAFLRRLRTTCPRREATLNDKREWLFKIPPLYIHVHVLASWLLAKRR
jgi:hypothetical protein